MAKWDKRLDKILKDEIEKNKDVYDLMGKIKDVIHGNTNIDTEYVEQEVESICSSHKLNNCIVESIEVKNTYVQNKVEKNPMNLTFIIRLKGDFNGEIIIKTSSGYRMENDERVNIYYVSSYDCEVRSGLQDKMRIFYEGFVDLSADKFIDLMFDRNIYLEYDTNSSRYSLWDRKPNIYEDLLTGYNETRYRQSYKDVYNSYKRLRKLVDAESIGEFARKKLDGKSQSVEWVKYEL